jgi:hypothetical protein
MRFKLYQQLMKFKLYREIHELRILSRQRDTQMHGSVPLVATMGDTWFEKCTKGEIQFGWR